MTIDSHGPVQPLGDADDRETLNFLVSGLSDRFSMASEHEQLSQINELAHELLAELRAWRNGIVKRRMAPAGHDPLGRRPGEQLSAGEREAERHLSAAITDLEAVMLRAEFIREKILPPRTGPSVPIPTEEELEEERVVNQYLADRWKKRTTFAEWAAFRAGLRDEAPVHPETPAERQARQEGAAARERPAGKPA